MKKVRIDESFSFIFVISHLPLSSIEACDININRHLGDPQPLYLRSDDGQFVFPTSSTGIFSLNQNQTVDVYCPSGFRGQLKDHPNKTITTQCIAGTQFSVDNNQTIEFKKIVCNRLPPHQQRLTSRKCATGRIVEIGFQTERNWLVLATVCHNFASASTRWVHYYQNPEHEEHQHNVPRIKFIQGDLYPGLNVEELYMRNEQRRTIAKILDSDELASNLVQETGDLFLARGHLAAKSDFIFGVHQHASFYFINAAPQWQTFNDGNWAAVEIHLRKYVDRQNIRIEIYTGTYGVVQYRDINGIPRDIHLASNDYDRRIPVPRIYYKVAIDVSQRAGVVLIGVNNPYATMEEIQSDYVFCENVMDQINYIPWNRTDIEKGYTYACRVDEFAKFIGELPTLPPIDKLLV